MDATETVEITSPVQQVNDTQTSKVVPHQGSVTTSVPSTFLPDDLGSTTPMMPTEDSAVTVNEKVPVSTMESLSTESETVASIPNVTSEIPQVSDIVVKIPSTDAYVSSVATETIPSTDELATAPLSTSEIPDTNMSATQMPSVPTVISTAVPEMISSTATTTTTGTTTDVPEPDLAMTTDTAVPVISTGPQTEQTDPPTVTTASTPRMEVSTLPPSVMTSESGGTTFPGDPFNTTRSPEVVGATTPKSTSPGLPGYVLLGSAGMPDWRLYLIMVSVIALALIMIMLIGWIITCVCMRRNYQRKTKKLLLNTMPSYRTVDHGPQYPLTAWPTVRTPANSCEDSVQHFAGNNEQPEGPPSPSRTGGYASIQRNRQVESDAYTANSHRTSTPTAQRPCNHSEQGWQPATLPSQVAEDQPNQPFNNLSSFQPAGGCGGSSTWSDYDLSVGRRGLRHVPPASDGTAPVVSSLRMHPNVHRGLLAEMNAGVRLHPAPPQPPSNN